MIVKAFIGRALTRLQNDLNDPGTPGFVAGPALPPPAGQMPRVVLSAGKMEAPAPFNDAPAGQVRPRALRDTPFPVNLGNLEGPYTLSQQPLEGTVSCRLAWNQPGDDLEGKKVRIYPRKGAAGDGFTIDYATREVRVYHAAPLSGVPVLEVEYTYAAIFSIREFRQMMSLEAYAATAVDAERWAALSASALISNTETLLRDTNASGNFHSSDQYVTEHFITDFQLSEGALERVADGQFRYTLQFRTAGQVIFVRSFADSAETIRKIFSPGHKNDAGAINIEANLD
jgi:hypothetical protein